MSMERKIVQNFTENGGHIVNFFMLIWHEMTHIHNACMRCEVIKALSHQLVYTYMEMRTAA